MEKIKERASFSCSVFAENWKSLEEYLLFLKEIFAYDFAANKISKDSTVLELGFGEGFGTKMLAKKAKKVFALDVDEKAFNHAKQKYSSEKILFSLYNGKKIPFEDNYFDAVVSLQVIEHIKDDFNFVNEIYRVTKKNAVVIITTPNRKIRLKENSKPWNEFHCKEYSEKELENLFNNFSSVNIFGVFASKEIMKTELNRIKKAVFMASLDPFKLRKFFPFYLKNTLKKIIKKVFANEKREFDQKKFSHKDFFISEKNADNSLDLLAVCRK